MAREPVILRRANRASDADLRRGRVADAEVGSGNAVPFHAMRETGRGPRRHIPPRGEILIIRTGRALSAIGGTRIAAEAGGILLGPAEVADTYPGLGPGRCGSIDIRLRDRRIRTGLDDPGAVEGA